MLEEIIFFYTSYGGPQLENRVLFKTLFFRKFIRRIEDKLEETNKKMKRSKEPHHCTKVEKTVFPYVDKM